MLDSGTKIIYSLDTVQAAEVRPEVAQIIDSVNESCCATSSSLLTHAYLVTSWCEAVKKMHFL